MFDYNNVDKEVLFKINFPTNITNIINIINI